MVYALSATLVAIVAAALRRTTAAARAREAQARASEAVLRESERRLRTTLELAPDGILITDAAGAVLFANTQAHRIFGYDGDELVGRAVETLVPDAVRARHAGYRADYSAQPRTRPMGAGIDLRGRRKDGAEVPVEISLSPMTTSDGMLVTSVVRDISDRKAVEARIRSLNDDLERRVAELAAVNRELEAFSYSVSHDLRAPLRSIDGFSQAILEDYGDRLDAEAREHLGRVRAAAQRMGELIDDLLDLSRITRRQMRRERVDVTALARTVVEALRHADPQRRVDVVVADGLVADADAHLLRVALENLLGNAWKFTGKTPAPRIEVGAAEADGRRAFFVRDNGVGFDMAYADKLFGAFQRLHAIADFPGTGIGLATVQRVVHRHGGTVWAEATVGRGATFYFTL